ncbi:conserved hypothetical protein [Candidatus Methylobacter favarea]|uniref:Uncharacterized protein n=1 Tax=Candidatus Methylobacter favarea TaxID=2707345 RepID=A0A8S0Y6B2_9GAMM|nr:conserved hypothetical protein [Candidatus Methylobacter favarea]
MLGQRRRIYEKSNKRQIYSRLAAGLNTPTGLLEGRTLDGQSGALEEDIALQSDEERAVLQ